MNAHDQPGPPDSSTDPAERARTIALNLLNHSPRSEGQLRAKMLAKDIPEDVADEVIERYRDVGLVNDPELAATIVRTRHRERGQSRRAIAMELRRKEFSPDVIEGALTEIDDASEDAAARELASKRWNQLEGVPHDARVRRVVGMLGRKGYGPGIAFAVVNSLERADRQDD